MKKLVSLCLALLLCAGLAAPAYAAGFSDVPSSHYAASAIDNCVAKGIVSGYADGTFRPSAPLTNAQFCVMVSRAFYPERVKEYDEPFYRDFGWYGPEYLRADGGPGKGPQEPPGQRQLPVGLRR